MAPLDIQIHDPHWRTELGEDVDEVAQRVLRACAKHLPQWQDFPPDQQKVLGVSLALVDDANIHKLNKEFRGKDKPTNVLSFPAYESVQELRETLDLAPEDVLEELASLGDILIAYQTVAREADEQGKSLYDHFCHLLAHGWLHLWGYDHMNDEDARIMEALEIAILAELSIANPYADDI